MLTVLKESSDKMKTLVIFGSGASFLLSAIFATVVFDKPSLNATLEQEIELGMSVIVTEQHIEVFTDAALYLQILVEIQNIKKLDKNKQNPEPGSIIDLFPIGSPAHGKGGVEFKIKSIPKDKFPDLRNRSQSLIPMAYIKSATFHELAKSIMKLLAVLIHNIGTITWFFGFSAFIAIVMGAAILFFEKAHPKPNQTAVEEMDD